MENKKQPQVRVLLIPKYFVNLYFVKLTPQQKDKEVEVKTVE